MKRTSLALVVSSLLVAAPSTVSAQGSLPFLPDVGAVADRLHERQVAELQSARRLQRLVDFRERVNDIWRETTPLNKRANEEVARARTALEAKRKSLADYLRAYGPPEQWPAEHGPKARELQALERDLAHLEAARAEVAALDDNARRLTGILQRIDQATFARNFTWYNGKAQELIDGVGNLRQTVASLLSTRQPSTAPPLRIKNDTKDVHVWVNGDLFLPGQEKRVSVSTGGFVQLLALGMTERRRFIIDKGTNPTRHSTVTDKSDYTLVFDLDTGAGNTHTEWRSHDESYRWATSSPHWKVAPDITVGNSGRGPTGDVLRFKVPFIPKDRFGANGWQSYALCFHGEVKWTMTRTGKMAAPPKTESESIRGGCVIIDVFSS